MASGVLSKCVFVKVLQGTKMLVFSCDVDINEATTFDSLLLLVLGIQGITIESLEKRDVAVTMVGDSRTGFGARPVRDLGVTVASRLAAGHFITFNVAPPPQKKLAPSLQEAEAERAASAARSMSNIMFAGRDLNSLPEKHDASKNLRSEQLWFNALVDYLQGTGLYFAKSEVCKQDGPAPIPTLLSSTPSRRSWRRRRRRRGRTTTPPVGPRRKQQTRWSSSLPMRARPATSA